jgi:competence protein ComEA
MTDWLERNRGFIVVTLINLALVGGLFFWLQRPVSTPVEITPPTATPSPVVTPTFTPAPVRVYVTGAVLHPDVYRLPPGSIVKEAIAAAGGTTDDADLNRINLAQELRDQQQLYVPHIGETEAPPPVTGGEPAPSVGGGTPGGKVNINAATVEELDTLPGIGPAIAQRIIDYRTANGPFKSIEEIKNVAGIGDATFEKIKDRITVGD